MTRRLDPASPSHSNQVISTNGRRAERIWKPQNPLDKEIQSLLVKQCRLSCKERCGFISTDEDIFLIDNVHVEPYHNFYMDQSHAEGIITEIYEIRKSKILGVWHTHPNGVPWPTARDLVGWPNPSLGWRYWIVIADEVIEWKLIEGILDDRS